MTRNILLEVLLEQIVKLIRVFIESIYYGRFFNKMINAIKIMIYNLNYNVFLIIYDLHFRNLRNRKITLFLYTEDTLEFSRLVVMIYRDENIFITLLIFQEIRDACFY